MTATLTSRPETSEYAPYYEKYMALVPEAGILPVLQSQLDELSAFLHAIPEAQGNVKHPPYTWSVKEVIGHVTDTERVFGYRALCIARGDTTPLPGFDENAYAERAGFDACKLSDLVAEFEHLRRSHLCLFRGLSREAWQRRGTANNNAVSVHALAYILVGHARHHCGILRKRLEGTARARRWRHFLNMV
jgi:hypothetical protein